MRTAGLPNFRKLYGMIEGPLEAGSYTVHIKNGYNTSGFGGAKSFVLSTTNALGGKNNFIAGCYIVVGSLSILFSIVFFAVYWMRRKAATSAK